MSLSLQAGTSLIRVTLMTPANFGAGGGSAAVDRPLGLDSWTGLGYLPDSALKGVLAGRLGNPEDRDRRLNEPRAKRFGRGDREVGGRRVPGAPGAVTLGEGRLLAFPLRVSSGRTAVVFPLDTLAWLQKLGCAHPFAALPRVEPTTWGGTVEAAELPAALHHLRRQVLAPDAAELARLRGAPLTEPWIVAARAAAADLFWHALDRRQLTAVEDDKTARKGSLRTFELMPAGSVLLALVSCAGDETTPLADPPVQLGAWEATGAGFAAITLVASRTLASRGRDAGTAEPPAGTRPTPEAQLMARALRMLESVQKDAPDAARPLRSAIREFGPRWRAQGLERTLAFCLAKARLRPRGGAPLTAAARAYQALLRGLFGEHLGAEELLATCRAVVAGAPPRAGAAPPPDLETTWLWLRRLSETLLPAEEPADAAE